MLLGIVEVEEIFVGQNSEILFYGQPAGVILADTMRLANLAATKVQIIYVESGKVFGRLTYFLLCYLPLFRISLLIGTSFIESSTRH